MVRSCDSGLDIQAGKDDHENSWIKATGAKKRSWHTVFEDLFQGSIEKKAYYQIYPPC
jgi:hypothetical protein